MPTPNATRAASTIPAMIAYGGIAEAAGASVTGTFSILINPALGFNQSSLPNGTVGESYKQTVTTSGGTGTKTFALSSGQLPAGLSLNKTTGVISGTPTTAGSDTFTVMVTDAVGASDAITYTLTVAV